MRPSDTGTESQSELSNSQELVDSALAQFQRACRPYNEAIGSYNTHLDNHRDRRDLDDLPFRVPISGHDAYEDAIDGDREAIEALLGDLLDEEHRDSELRRHPRTFPIHIEACEHLRHARAELINSLEDALYHAREHDE